MYYINIFFIYSILGFIVETFFVSMESGILYGPWTIVYGFGMTFIYLVYDKFLHKFKYRYLYLFLISFVFLPIFEIIGGNIIEKLFGVIYWDYEIELFSIGKYTSLFMALLWGISSVITFYFIRDFLDKIVKKIPKFITWIVIILFIIDIVCSLIFKSKLISFFKILF